MVPKRVLSNARPRSLRLERLESKTAFHGAAALADLPHTEASESVSMRTTVANGSGIESPVAMASERPSSHHLSLRAIRRPRISASVLPHLRTPLAMPPAPTSTPPESPPVAKIINGTETTAYEAVGLVGSASGFFCSGTLIDTRHVLTAGHCAVRLGPTDGRFRVGGTTYSTSLVTVHPGYAFPYNDLAVLTLADEVPAISPSPIYRDMPQVGQSLILVGYGHGGTTGSGEILPFGVKRVGLTPIDSVTADKIRWRFDGDGESNTAHGDSGGAGYIMVDGALYLAGVTSGGYPEVTTPGYWSFDMRVDAFAVWIDAALANTPPSTPNQPPIAASDHAEVYRTEWTTIDALANDRDPDGDRLMVVAHSEPAHGTLFHLQNGRFDYFPRAGHTGADAFTYTVSDGRVERTATVEITVLPLLFAVDDYLTVRPGKIAEIRVRANDTERRDGVTLIDFTQPRQATIGRKPGHPNILVVQPKSGFRGTLHFSYRLRGPQGKTVSAQVFVTVE